MSLLDAAGVINGDIWCNGAFDFESPLKDLLDSGEYTMEQLLAEDELLQEIRGVHPQLIEFFSTEEAVARLIQYIIVPPSTELMTKPGVVAEKTAGENGTSEQKDSDATSSKKESNGTEDKEHTNEEKSIEWLGGDEPQEEASPKEPKSPEEEMEDRYIRFPYMACEVICCEIKGIIDLLVDGTVPLLSTDNDGEEENGKTKEISSLQISEDARGKPILDLFFSMLYKSEIGEIDDYRAGYFEKVLSILFRYRPKDVAQYLNEGGGKGNVALMSAMFKHLYSHSLMQIVQRLLLPQPPQPQRPEVDGEEKDETNECEDLFNDTMEGAEMDPLDSFRCNWCESEEALEMVLESLVGESGKPTANIQMDGDDEDERMLDLYQNASEVLITIIQNSPLTSLTMRTLTTDPNLGRLIEVATQVEEGSEFSRHDSRLTCAMNVLESLILQLGGYGSVGTMIYEEGQGPFENVIGEPISEEQKTTGGTDKPQIIFATPETLIYHLPGMLSCLSNLLAYPGADDWKSPMQFSKTKEQPILGSSRLRIVRLLESLVLLGNNKIDSVLCDSSCLEVCLDLFWKFQWCSMLHQSVANLLVHAFEGQNSRSELQSYFIERCNLIGRLMYSFWTKEPETNISSIISASSVELSESVTGQKDSDSENSPVSDASGEKESGTTSDVLPVSDDDVDVAMEQSIPGLQGAQSSDSNDTKLDSLRLGYMGHVIIICQALVHACTEEGDAPTVDSSGIPREMVDEQGQLGSHLGEGSGERVPKQTDDSYTDDYTSAYTSTDGDTLTDALILARLVKKHPLGKIWKDFVVTTLASETALQTTPLGGFQAPTLGADPLHMHRPGLEDDGAYDDDDGEAPTLPQRGLLVDGDVIDMDDNDLEVAANMMAGLNLAQVTGNGDSQLQSNISHQGGYVFDDPLGSGRFGDFDDDDDEGDSSSDEEGEMIGNNRGSEAPVMDLFAGNFDAFDETDTREQSPSAFSDFANFDDAFADTEVSSSIQQSENKNEVDDGIFADVKSHDILLDELDKPVSPQNGTLSDD
eukprot:CAMPEP_0116117554 /NCGR_PEP_ID=MMETSP0329-20121206/1633_1 /TAXON_ID=697910 /ORGANISM="Pseudo-nitzschia arenysensis, Strain B593" /LENGTH=1038 /DNA_ID=CAMNT_0003611123 /DNA_START=233 /DNA_END=3349 /DNA_ORIENTATION=-